MNYLDYCRSCLDNQHHHMTLSRPLYIPFHHACCHYKPSITEHSASLLPKPCLASTLASHQRLHLYNKHCIHLYMSADHEWPNQTIRHYKK